MVIAAKINIQQSSICHSLKFESVPNDFLQGSNIFQLRKDLGDSINGRFAWYNGADSLSKVADEESSTFSTWIVSPEQPGINNYESLSNLLMLRVLSMGQNNRYR